MDCECKHTAQPTPARGLQLPRKMLNSITTAVARQEAGRDCSQLPGAMSPRSKSRLCPQFHVNLEKRQKKDCWSPCKVVMVQQGWHSGCLESGSGPKPAVHGGSALWGEAHTTFIPANLSEHQTAIQRCLLKTSFGIKPWPEGICSTENSALTLNPFFPQPSKFLVTAPHPSPSQISRAPCHSPSSAPVTTSCWKIQPSLFPPLAWLFPTPSELELLYIITAPLFIIIP